MKLTAKRLTAQQATAVWADFYTAHGTEAMERAYGWETPTSRSIRPGERVWAFYDIVLNLPGGAHALPVRVGWGSVQLNLNDPDAVEAELVCGVFPNHQRKGYRHAIRDWMSRWAQAKGAKYAKVTVYKENEEHYDRVLNEALAKGPWTHAGDVWFPAPGFGIFIRDLEDMGDVDAARAALNDPANAVRVSLDEVKDMKEAA